MLDYGTQTDILFVNVLSRAFGMGKYCYTVIIDRHKIQFFWYWGCNIEGELGQYHGCRQMHNFFTSTRPLAAMALTM